MPPPKPEEESGRVRSDVSHVDGEGNGTDAVYRAPMVVVVDAAGRSGAAAAVVNARGRATAVDTLEEGAAMLLALLPAHACAA
jgi:hypothetical protein